MADGDDRLEDPRPTFHVDGEEQADARQGLLSLLIAEDAQGLYRCEASFGNLGASGSGAELLYFDRRTFDFGKTLRVTLKKDVLFEGRITGLEGRFPAKSPPELVVLAEDALQDLRMTRRTRTFLDQSDADVFEAIAGEHGLDKNIRLGGGGTHKVLAQVNQSDLAFLRDRARAIEAELWVSKAAGGKAVLNAVPRADRPSGAAVKLGWRNELTELSVIADLAGQRTAVVASGWDVNDKAGVKYEAADGDLGGELGNDESGASILKAKFGERKESVAHGVPFNQAEAETRAKAHFKMEARRFVVGTGVARTTGKLRVGAMVDLDGVGPLFNGKYYLAEVRHRFDGARGLRTEFSAERAGLGRP